MRVRRETERPTGRSVSWSQISQALTCGKRLEFHRNRVKQKNLSVSFLYGRSIHSALAAHQKGYARTAEEVVAAAVRALDYEIQSARLPIRWDELWETTKDGTISAAAKNYGRLPNREACLHWLRVQVPLLLQAFPQGDVKRSEHRIFVPLSEPRGARWSTPWSLECYIDLELRGDRIGDLKSTDDAWKPQDLRKSEGQALVYMGAYYHFYDREPTQFEFHVLPRLRAEADGVYVPSSKAFVHEVPWDARRVQNFYDDVVKPVIGQIEAGVYPANPGSGLCTSKYCGFWDHCKFGGKTDEPVPVEA